MTKCRIVGKRTKWIVQAKFLGVWCTEYDLVDDVYSIVSPEMYGPLRVDKEFNNYVEALDYINAKYPDHLIY